MPASYVEYTTDGGGVYVITMPRLDDDHISITIAGAASTNFTISGNDLTLTGGDAGSNFETLRITRTTPEDYVQFQAGSTLAAVDLNNSQLVSQYRNEEIDDANDETDTSLDARLTALEGVTSDGTTGNSALGGRMTTAEGEIDVLQSTTTDGTSGNSALNTRLGTAEGEIDVLQTTTTDGTSGNSALNTRLVEAEDQLGAAFAFHSNGTTHNFNSTTATLVPFATTMIGGPSAVNGEYQIPFDGFYLVTVTLSPSEASLTVDDRWLISIGTRAAPSARRAWFEPIFGNLPGGGDSGIITDTITLTAGLSLSAGDYIGAYVRRFSGTGNFTLNAAAADNTFSGICIAKY